MCLLSTGNWEVAGSPECSGRPDRLNQSLSSLLGRLSCFKNYIHMSYFVYIIKSLKDNSFYIGSTNDLDRRLSEHNQGLSKYTSAKTPWDLVYSESFGDVTAARKREYFLKKQRNRAFYQKLIDSVR